MPRGTFTVRNAKYLLLTYAQVPNDIQPIFGDAVVSHLCSLSAECIVGRECHADGGIHFHVFVEFERPYTTRTTTAFDIHGRHPNIEKVTKTPWVAYDYATKDGDVVAGGCIRPAETGGLSGIPGGDSGSNDWGWIIEAESRDEFLRRISTTKPRDLVCSFGQITRYADWKYAPAPVEYETPAQYQWRLDDHPELGHWVENELAGAIESLPGSR